MKDKVDNNNTTPLTGEEMLQRLAKMPASLPSFDFSPKESADTTTPSPTYSPLSEQQLQRLASMPPLTILDFNEPTSNYNFSHLTGEELVERLAKMPASLPSFDFSPKESADTTTPSPTYSPLFFHKTAEQQLQRFENMPPLTMLDLDALMTDDERATRDLRFNR